jgi:hypothetical protein
MYREEKYVTDKGFSQSDLKIFEDSPKAFLEQVLEGNRPEQERKRCFDEGDLTDIFLLQQELITNYAVIDAVIGDTVKAVLQRIYTHAKFEGKKINPDIKMYLDYVEPVCKELAYYYNPATGKWSRKIETLKDGISTEGATYFAQYVNALENNKREVLKADWDTAERLENKFWESTEDELKTIVWYVAAAYNATLKDTEDYDETVWYVAAAYNATLKDTEDYDETVLELPENIQVLRAYSQYGNFREHEVKHLGDLCILDHEAKTAQCFDLKTADSITGFYRNYWGQSYIRQGALTSYICKQNYPDYDMLPFTFIVIPKNNEKIELFEMSEDEMNAGLFGGTFTSGKRYRGVAQILDDINWHITQNVWDHKRKYYENGNKNILNSFKDINAELLDIF